jgi:hypothetical protein
VGKVERAVVEALVHGINGGLPYVPEADLEVAARAAGGAGRAAEYAVARLVRRGLLSSQWEGTRRVGYRPTVKAYEELGQSEQAEPRVAPDCGGIS